MLVIDDLLARVRARHRGDDDGAVLVTVVVIMLVGFIVAATIASAVMFTITSNKSNEDRTQSFIAAESGRDVAVGALRSAIGDSGIDCSAVALADASVPGESPRYAYKVRSTDDATRPSSFDDAALTDTCPTESTKWVVIQSTGWGANSAQSTIDSVYPWYHGPATQPAGTLAYFEGEFKATKSTYQGDLVIRDTGDYECNNGASGTIEGDLWVLNGGLRITSDCTVTGSIYTRGLIEIKNHLLTVGGDVVSLEGTIKLNAGSVKIGGDVYAGGNIDTKNGSGVVNGSFKASGSMIDHTAASWKRLDNSAVPTLTGQPAPVITPTLDQVFDATSWIELTSTIPWSTDATVYTGVCDEDELEPVLAASGPTRAVLDMTACTAPNGKTVIVDPGNVSIGRDVLFYVPSNMTMDLQLNDTITKAVGATDPQLVIIHADADGADSQPTCTTGSDKFTAGNAIGVRTMVYSACGINNSMALTMTGQLYMGNLGIHLNGGVFTCKPMSWEPAFKGLSCGVKGPGGIFDPSDTVTRLDGLAYQTER